MSRGSFIIVLVTEVAPKFKMATKRIFGWLMSRGSLMIDADETTNKIKVGFINKISD